MSPAEYKNNGVDVCFRIAHNGHVYHHPSVKQMVVMYVVVKNVFVMFVLLPNKTAFPIMEKAYPSTWLNMFFR